MKKIVTATIGVPSFSELSLLPGLVKVLDKMKIHKPTSIQVQAIPSLLNTNDHHMIAAQTGTGKTLTYVLPLFHKLKQLEISSSSILTQKFRPSAIVVVPNRELSSQCEKVMSNFKHDVRLKTSCLYSGKKFNAEAKELESGVDILVGTPEKIDRHRRDKTLFFDNVKYMVVDEADTLIDGGNSNHLDLYCEELIKKTSFSFFAATFPKSVELFLGNRFSFDAEKNGDKPVMKKIIEERTHLNLTHLKHEFIQLQEFDKRPLFLKIMQKVEAMIGKSSCLVFCNSIQSARATDYFMNNNGFKVVSLHGDIPSKKRLENIEKFRDKQVKHLVCTDLGSRGLDFPFVDFVVNFDFPRTVSDYIHRAGRAGRAGRPGSVFSLYRKNDLNIVDQLKHSYDTKKPLKITTSAFSVAKQRNTPDSH